MGIKDWLVYRWDTLQEAVGLNRFVLGSTATLVISIYEYAAGEWGMNWLLGIPRPLVIAIFVLLMVGFWLLNHAAKLRKEREPKIELRFAPTGKFVRDVPYQTVQQVSGCPVPQAVNGMARYISIEAINRSLLTARDCSAYLLAVKKVGQNGELLDTGFDETMKLNWSVVNGGIINLDSEIHRLFNILFVLDSLNEIQFAFADGYPLKLNDLCKEPGTYRMRVCVRGDGVQSETLPIEVNWTGKMISTTANISQWPATSL